MGCRRCRGWEESECCLSQQAACDCECHAKCDCAFCHAVVLKARTSSGPVPECTLRRKSTTSRITTALRLDSRASTSAAPTAVDGMAAGRPSTELRASTDNHRSLLALRWSRRSSALKPLRMFA
ncbi:hypothetical protein H4R18_000737 [Coemansia javaensis]|uniref:Uncharacterized protein n=1 Tax=Coemansia javaensis TaxID=2761396 RepID=A0A9W8LL84_9FUNG|nr:hypothetical protein H4R18_000737 [Coemansia javaensis]